MTNCTYPVARNNKIVRADTEESRRFITFTHCAKILQVYNVDVFLIINRESRLRSYRNRHAYT